MGVRERREREKDATRRKILDAARELFAQQGYEAVSLRRIADAIEYSPTAIYVHFKDKADLMKELCRQDFESFAEEVRQFAGVADPVERIQRSGRLYIRFAIEHPNHFRLMFMTKPIPELVELDEQEMDAQGRGDPNRDAYAFLMQCVEEAVTQGRIREELQDDPELVAQILWASLHGVASLQIARPDNEPWFTWKGADVLGDAMSRTIFRGILREEPPIIEESPVKTVRSKVARATIRRVRKRATT
jgi:AcrR family transcriptional regulator